MSLGRNSEQWVGPTSRVTICCCDLYAVLWAVGAPLLPLVVPGPPLRPPDDAWSLLGCPTLGLSSLLQVRQVCSKLHLLPNVHTPLVLNYRQISLPVAPTGRARCSPCPCPWGRRCCVLPATPWGLIHETDLRGKLRPKHEVRNYRRKVTIHESGQREVAT